MDTVILVDMIARMTKHDKEQFILEMEKRYPNLVDELYILFGYTAMDRQSQLEFADF